MSQNFISNAFMQFKYFDLQLDQPDWRNKLVLDFGGNVGNILQDPFCSIQEKNYWCLDVSRKAILEGAKRYPEANFVFYDCHNYSFNPTGIEGLSVPDLGVKFDYIISYSIFSHMDRDEMVNKVNELVHFLNDDGILAFTFLVADFNGSKHYSGYQDVSNFEKRVRKLNEGKLLDGLLEKSIGADALILTNGRDLYHSQEAYDQRSDKNGETIFSYFTPSCMKSLFPKCEIKIPPAEPYDSSYPGELQHVCLIRKALS